MSIQSVIAASYTSSSDFWDTPPRHSMKDLCVFTNNHSSPSSSKNTVGPEGDDDSICTMEVQSLGCDYPQPHEPPSNCTSNPIKPSDGFLSATKANVSATKSLVCQLKKGRPGNKPGSLKQRPNCLFLNHLGTRRVSKTALQAAACEAVLEIESSDFNDPACSFRIPEEVFCPLGDIQGPSRGQYHPSFSAPKSSNDYEPIAIPSSSTRARRYFSDQNNSLSEDTPRDQARAPPLADDFIGMPSDHNVNAPTDYALMGQAPGYRVGVPTDFAPQDIHYPTESPIRRSNVIEVVGPPTDFLVEPSIDDPDGAGIGLVIPPFPSAGPSRAKRTIKKKGVSVRKCRFSTVESVGYPNTALQSPPYRRRVSSSLSTHQSPYPRSGSMPPSPVTNTRLYHQYPATVSPYRPPRTFTKISRRTHYGATVSPLTTRRVSSGRALSTQGPPYRRQSGSGLSPMPYSLAPPLASSCSRRVRFSNPY